MEGAFERDDESAVALLRRHDAIEERGLDRVLDRLGPRVDDEVARRAGGRDAVQLGLEPQREDGLVLGVGVARRDERQRLKDGLDHDRVVLAEGLGGDECTHVEEAVRLAGSVPVDHRKVRSDRLRRIKGDRQGEEQAARGGLERCMRRRQIALDQLLERALAVMQRLRDMNPHLAGAVLRVELRHALENLRDWRESGGEGVHSDPRPGQTVSEPSTQVTLCPPTQIAPSSANRTETRPSRPRHRPWLAR